MKSSTPMVQIPAEHAQMLSGEAERLGIDLPGVIRLAPTIDVTMPIRKLALELGRTLSLHNIFLQNDEVVTVDAETGEMEVLNSKSFPAWAEEFCVFIAPGSRRVRDSLSVDDAAQILSARIFKNCLRPLTAVHKMVLPVRRERKDELQLAPVEFLKPGYDQESGIFTVEEIEYDQTWTLGRSQKWFLDVCGEFPWNATELSQKRGLGYNRSLALHVMACVGQYCKAMFPPGTLFPIVAYFANKPGTGKTRLMEMTVSAVHGYAAATGAPKEEEKMEVKLDAVARSMQPYLLFDDIGGGLRSNTLNRWTSASWHTGREFHSNSAVYKVPNVTQVFVTANDLKTSEDIQRRMLIVELFLDQEVKGRKFQRTISPKWLAEPETRASFLSACNAMVRHWLAAGQPLAAAGLETYEDWTQTMAGIVTSCEWTDPLAPPEGIVGGAQDEDEIKELLIKIASEKERDTVITRRDLIKAARKHGLLEDLVGTIEDAGEDVDAATGKKIGRRLQRWRAQKLKDEKDRTFQFSHKRQKNGATYPLVFIDGQKRPVVPTELALDPHPVDDAGAAGDEPEDWENYDRGSADDDREQ